MRPVLIGPSHFVKSVPMRLYGVSKSNLVASAAGTSAAPAAAASELPGVTAPTSAVNPAFLRNDLRFSPSFCDMRMLLVDCSRCRRTGRYYTHALRLPLHLLHGGDISAVSPGQAGKSRLFRSETRRDSPS